MPLNKKDADKLSENNLNNSVTLDYVHPLVTIEPSEMEIEKAKAAHEAKLAEEEAAKKAEEEKKEKQKKKSKKGSDKHHEKSQEEEVTEPLIEDISDVPNVPEEPEE